MNSLVRDVKPRTRGSISTWRLQLTGGNVPGGAPVGRATRRCWPGRNEYGGYGVDDGGFRESLPLPEIHLLELELGSRSRCPIRPSSMPREGAARAWRPAAR